jgi:hypothetical protein
LTLEAIWRLAQMTATNEAFLMFLRVGQKLFHLVNIAERTSQTPAYWVVNEKRKTNLHVLRGRGVLTARHFVCPVRAQLMQEVIAMQIN